jgi:hypothetical protein
MSDNMKDQINRLGYGAWAENIIVNFMEDWKDDMLSNKGNMTIERDEYTINASFEYDSLCITVRAYVEGDGWQMLEQNIKLK